MKLVDSHCHLDRLDLTPYDDQFKNFVEATVKEGLEHMLCVSIDLESWPAMQSLIAPFDNISTSVGVHPNEQEGEDPTIEKLVELATTNKKVVAIGETGLDYFRSEGGLNWQKERFRRHIQAAIIVDKPLIIHTREARDDTLRILKEEGAEKVGGVLHCFTEDWEMAQEALEMNFYISFSGIVTFNSAKQIQEVAKKVPDDRFLIETDSPYLAPVPFRGKPNYPIYVGKVAEFIAELRGTTFEEVVSKSNENFYRLFRA
ncbi:MAG TPA: TatD family deoxyribonuclease [Thermodesulforhabdus norvegica]|uniref:TatD family deoxyribonuclease n=1 Tax=Thermodesulforhabdus norvegica TaxID=39841 RepID=A0A7C0WUN8_9BACT|nr:MAG: TatD family deoxyribonuclease [Gammaproteobacteria bacterium]HDL89830.1 TatD family deoxyribonuclease [Thermodesulforhabdus norvegica]